jgi:2,4-diaminobutyrate 4-transaminase
MVDRISLDVPQLRVPHPGPKTVAHLERVRKAEGQSGLTFALSPETLVMERAQGWAVEDIDGNLFLDFVAGFGSLNAGHCHPRVVGALQEQAAKLHQAMSVATEPRTRLLEKILSLVPGPSEKKVLFATSGSEAAETAIKLARRAKGRHEIIAFGGGFHGRTMGALSLMGRKNQREGLPVLVPGAHHIPYPYPFRSPFGRDPETCVEGTIRYMEELLGNPASGLGEVAAVIVEPVQGNGGMIPAPLGFLRALRGLCDRHDLLLILDEVMSGFFRTGRVFAFEHEEGVEPDLLVLGKSISGGIPLAACVAKRDIADATAPGTESGTYSGNVMACAAGLASISVYEDEGLKDNAREMGSYFLERLNGLAGEFEMIGEVRGRGLMLGVELVADRSTREPLPVAKGASEKALKKGLLLYPGGHYGNVIAFLPPLIIGQEQVDRAVAIIEEVLTELGRNPDA